MKTSQKDASSPGNEDHETRTAHPDSLLLLMLRHLRVYAKCYLGAWLPPLLLI